MINFFLIIVVLGQVVTNRHTRTSDKSTIKNIQFEYKEDKKSLRIILNKSWSPYISKGFKIKAEIQTRISSTDIGLVRKRFFHLLIVPRWGKHFHFYEELDDKAEVSNIDIDPNIKYSFSVPTSIDPFPGAIFYLYNTLKENHLKE